MPRLRLGPRPDDHAPGPNAVVLGGGVSLMGETLWLRPLRQYVASMCFRPWPTRSRSFRPAGEEMVVYGALAWRLKGMIDLER